tara:strand:+ start:198 stop:914 length:717 start_codon:yes stop_codon:yes gene_type:complete
MKNFRYSVERDYGHVIQHLESLPNTARIIDIGGGYNPWCKRFVTHYVDLYDIEGAHTFKGNVNMHYVWEEIVNYLDGEKFDYAICTHMLEDVANPEMTLRFLPQIAKAGFISMPSKYTELTPNLHNIRGSIHHRWIYNKEKSMWWDDVDEIYKEVDTLVGYPKVVWLQGNEDGISDKIGFSNWNALMQSNLHELSFVWENQIFWKFMNDDFMGPDDNSVKTYYQDLLDPGVERQDWGR